MKYFQALVNAYALCRMLQIEIHVYVVEDGMESVEINKGNAMKMKMKVTLTKITAEKSRRTDVDAIQPGVNKPLNLKLV
jgi:hypothetical protein